MHATNKQQIVNCLNDLARKNSASADLKNHFLQQAKLANDLFTEQNPLNKRRTLAYEHFIKGASSTESTEEAITSYQAALEIMNALLANQLNSNDNRFYLQIFAALGDLYYDCSDWRQARSAYADALEYHRAIDPDTDEDNELRQHCLERKGQCDHSIDRKHAKTYGVSIPKPLQKELRNDPVAQLHYAYAASNSKGK